MGATAAKICSECGLPGEFRGNRRKCRACERKAARVYGRQHAEQRAAWDRENRKKRSGYSVRHARKKRVLLRQRLDEMKSNPCTDCGQAFLPYVMDLDHKKPESKVAGVNYLLSKAVSWERIQAEIDKCDLVCVCCHRLRTLQQTGVSRHSKRRLVLGLKEGQPCTDCGGLFHPCQMDFDHAEGGKSGCVSRMTSTARIREEAAKCDLVCANCHRKRTQERGDFHKRFTLEEVRDRALYQKEDNHG